MTIAIPLLFSNKKRKKVELKINSFLNNGPLKKNEI
jgi:hypothetical protein